MRQTENGFPLRDELCRIIRAGELSFKDFMGLALYHPQFGYYSAQAAPGRRGDFFTSVSVGSCFGELLAEYIHAVWQEAGSPNDFVALEQGGHVGVLAADVLAAICAKFPAFYKVFRLLAVEKSSRAMTDPRLASHDCWTVLASLDDLPLDSVDLLFGNELLDAFPVHRVRWLGPPEGWVELYVDFEERNARFVEREGPLTGPELSEAVSRIDVTNFPLGYTTEVNLELAPWLAHVKRFLRSEGKALMIDYGMQASTYYLASRAEGTLQAYRNHQRIADPLESPGDQDLTAHVDFTELQRRAEACGLHVTRLEEQSRFLTRMASGPLVEMEVRLHGNGPDKEAMQWIRQFQQLTAMGPHFKVMELTQTSSQGTT